MDLEVLQARETFVAGRTAVGLLVSVSANVNKHFVPVDTPTSFILAFTSFPFTP